jgi:LysM repeat protein
LYHFLESEAMRENIRRRKWSLVRLTLVTVLLLAALPLTAAAQGGTYTVRSGDTLASIAKAYGVSVNSIVAANGLSSPDHIIVGQRLAIPGAPGGSASGATGSAKIYIVQAGDTLAKISQKYGVSSAAIMAANGIQNANLIRVGQRLTIPGGGSAPAPRPAPAPAAKSYTVRSGDTLGAIAARYGVSASAIASANGLADPNRIYPGLKLVIPGGKAGVSAPSGRATKFVVSISRQRCWVYQGNTVVYEWVCSTGRRASPTKAGAFAVQSKMPKAYGSTWNIWMPYWLGIYWAGGSENGIHGMPWNASSGKKTWPGLVGTPITYGCVMLNDAQAKALYDMSWIGMPVVVKY